MNEEIKEILDIERYRNKDGYVENINLLPDEMAKLFDYITNLQEEIERLNNIINQLEKELKDDYKIWMCNSRSNGKSVKFGIDVCKMHFYNRLQELKGVDKE